MKLKKLEIYGFKSFAQRTEIVFNEGITGIVGPNGSGKSNIGDAVRWVLGEQSAKTLRGAKMEDVIFGGTQKRKALSYCEVTLVFDNEDHALPMETSEVAVTRRVYRSGEGEYFLNRTACRLKDVVELFRDTGIGKEGYSIIGQGRIDEILSQKGEDRRQVFEEAAGIVKFKVRKEDADKRLARTLENMERVDDILRELERQLGPLEKQSETAREYIALSGELRVLDLNLFLLRHDKLKAKLAELDAALAEAAAVLAQNEAILAEKTARRDDQQDLIQQKEQQVSDLRGEQAACADRVHTLQTELASLVSRREAVEENVRRMEEEQARSREHLAEYTAVLDGQDGGLKQQMDLLDTAHKTLVSATRVQESLDREEQEKEQALEAHKTRLMEAMNRSSALQNDQTRQTTMRAQMEARLGELTSEKSGMEEKRTALEAARRAADDRLREEQARFDRLRKDHSETAQDLEKRGAELAQLRQTGQQKAEALQALTGRLKVMEEMARDMEGFNQSVKRAVSFARSQRMDSVRGVLAQLLTVPKEYETAIDMALGAAQQNIVTETEQDAKRLIDYLRQNRFGRATFLPMSAMRPKLLGDREKQALRLPGCVGVASDLVQCAPEYRAIVENLLGRTVIATDLDAGIPIMRAGNHAFRLVTLTGDVMHSGGSMTGGSVQSRVSNLIGREREIGELTAQAAAARDELDRLRQKAQTAQAERDSLRQRVEESLESVHQAEIGVARETQRLQSATDELAEHRERMDQSAEAAGQLRQAMDDIDAQLADLAARSAEGAFDPEHMQQETARLTQELQKAREASAAQREQVMTLTLRQSDLQHELDSLQKDKVRLSQDVEQTRRDLTRRAGQIEGLTAMAQESAGKEAALTTQLETSRAEQGEMEKRVSQAETERFAAQGDLRTLLQDIEALHTQSTQDSDRQHRLDMARTKVDTDLRTLQDRIWNTYELTYAGAEAERVTEDFDVPQAEERAQVLQRRIRAMGTVNVGAVEEYADTKARFDELNTQKEDLLHAESDLRELIDRLLQQMETTFVENFTLMQGYFSETFERLFGGGHAELRLSDPADALNCGIDVIAQPPGKKLQLLSLLSGGERALTAIAILCAMLKLKPTPFCILDEIEAALDEANVGYFADYLVEYSKSTQFVVVTHRKGTMERCNSLYGVAMEEQGVSKMVSVSLQDYAG